MPESMSEMGFQGTSQFGTLFEGLLLYQQRHFSIRVKDYTEHEGLVSSNCIAWMLHGLAWRVGDSVRLCIGGRG